MYNCYFEDDDSGEVFYFGYKYGVLFDLSPLSGVSVDLQTQTAYRQEGEAITSYSLPGISREITGLFYDVKKRAASGDADAQKNGGTIAIAAQKMVDMFAPGVTGKLYFCDGDDAASWYCDATVEEAPVIEYKQDGRRREFSLTLFCHSPFWTSTTTSAAAYYVGNYVILQADTGFTFPTYYENHSYGAIDTDSTYSTSFSLNVGSASVPLDISVTSLSGDIDNFYFKDKDNGTYLLIPEIKEDDTVHVYWNSSGNICADYTELNSGVYTTTSSLDNISLKSTLLYLEGGAVNYKIYWSSSTGDAVKVTINYAERAAGVIVTE